MTYQPKYSALDELMPEKYRWRKNQRELVETVVDVMQQGQISVINAPTGSGKTISMLLAAQYAGKKVMFITPVTSQHEIVIQNMLDLGNNKVVSLWGKQKMCVNEEVKEAKNFYDACSGSKCKMRMFTYGQNGEKTSQRDSRVGPGMHTQAFIDECRKCEQCPYDSAIILIPECDTVLANYLHIFDPEISEAFFRSVQVEQEDYVLVVDEAHNLPDKLREMASKTISQRTFENAITEIREHNELFGKTAQDAMDYLSAILTQVKSDNLAKEQFYPKDRLIGFCNSPMCQELHQMGLRVEGVKKRQNKEGYSSYMKAVSTFLNYWAECDVDERHEGMYVRILKEKSTPRSHFLLEINCLDCRPLAQRMRNFDSVVLMSGTMKPPYYFKTVLGIGDAVEKVFPSIFPAENKIIDIATGLTTRSKMRSPVMYMNYALQINRVIKETKGNVGVFFPSKQMLEDIRATNVMLFEIDKDIITEEDENTILHIHELMAEGNKVLLAWVRGRLHEGVDYKNDALAAIVIVGFPFPYVSLEQQALTAYFDREFKKAGFLYASLLPTVNLVLQTMGRGVRSATDKCHIYLMDNRYASSYRRYFDLSDGTLYLNGVRV